MQQQRRTNGWMKTAMALGIACGSALLLGSQARAQNVTITTGDAPAAIFNQDNSQSLGFQNWSLSGDETGVSLDDNTGGQTPLTVFKGAPDNSVVVASNGRVGIGASAPEGNLHINGLSNQDVFNGVGPDPAGNSNTGALNFGYSGFSFGVGSGFFNVRPVTTAVAPNPSLRFATGNIQRMITTNIGRVGIGNVAPTQVLDVTGNIRASGNFISGATTLNVPDYVFAPDYKLRPLSEVAAYIEKERHLPEIPSAETIKAEGLNLSEFQMKLLQKIEELTLYALQQEKVIRAQAETIGMLRTEFHLTVDTLTERLQTLEQQQTASQRNGQ